MSNLWNYMVDQLSGELDYLGEGYPEYEATDRASVYVEQLLLPADVAITYSSPLKRAPNVGG